MTVDIDKLNELIEDVSAELYNLTDTVEQAYYQGAFDYLYKLKRETLKRI